MLLFPLLLSAQIPDGKIPHFIGDYFMLNRVGPELVCIDIFEHPQSGRTLKIKVIGRRSLSERDLAFAFAAAASVANLAEYDFELLWVEMVVQYKGPETIMALAPAKCTIEAIVLQNCEAGNWWNDCLEFL